MERGTLEPNFRKETPNNFLETLQAPELWILDQIILFWPFHNLLLFLLSILLEIKFYGLLNSEAFTLG